jgi:hypothetical protein
MDTPAPTTEEALNWRRRLAAASNNAGWSLVEKAERTPAETDAMLDAAHASAHLWHGIGTELHRARAHMLLAFAHGLAGNAALATRYATATLDYFRSHDCPDWEIAFAHAAAACAAHAAGDRATHAAQHATALRLAGRIADAEDRAVFDRTFARVALPPR